MFCVSSKCTKLISYWCFCGNTKHKRFCGFVYLYHFELLLCRLCFVHFCSVLYPWRFKHGLKSVQTRCETRPTTRTVFRPFVRQVSVRVGEILLCVEILRRKVSKLAKTRRNLVKNEPIFTLFTLKNQTSSQIWTLSTHSTRKIPNIILRRDFCVHVRVGRASNEFAS